MAPIHKYRNDDGDLEEVELIESLGWAYKEASEEGESASVTITVPDPDMTLNFVPWRRWITYEDESESDDTVLFSGFVSSYEIGRTGGEDHEPLGRVWTLNLVDMNTLWDNRVMVGSDTKRPAETDVERMTWLVGTEEMGYFDDISLIAAGDPVNMDKRDTRGTTPKAIADDAAQQASKNYWIAATIDGIFVWYGKDENNSYLSPLSLSNDPADWTDAALADGSSTVWPLSYDAKLAGSGERIYSGAYVEYEKGAVYRRNTATMDYFTLSGRDISHPAPEIKTKTKAIARANALVNRLDEVLLRVTTTVELPAAKATMLKTGMLVDIKATHWPSFEVGRSCRIVNAMAVPAASGNKYRVTIEAVPVDVASDAVHYFGCPYVLDDVAPGTNGVSHSYSVASTPAVKHGNIFLLGDVTSNASDYEAFKDSTSLPYLTDGYCAGFPYYWGGRGPSGMYVQVSTKSIAAETPMSLVAAARSADTIIVWSIVDPSNISITAMSLTIDGASVGSFSPTWGPTQWRESDAGAISYLNTHLGDARVDSSLSLPYGVYFDLGAVHTGTDWKMTFTTAFGGTSSILRLVEIQGFDFS